MEIQNGKKQLQLSAKASAFLLAGVIVARSISYLLSKVGLEGMGPFTLMALRFLIAFFLLLVLFRKKLTGMSKRTLLFGLALGGTFFSVMTAELFGLSTTPSTTVSFLENTAIVIVPLLEGAIRRKLPRLKVLLSGAAALLGVGLITLRGGTVSFESGEFLCLLAALLYACAIILTDRLSKKEDPLVLGILQVGTMGVLGLVFGFLFETPHLPAGGVQWAAVLGLSIVCSGFGFTLQPVAQRGVNAETAGLFCALNPLTASVLGRIFLNERLGVTGILGALCILFSIVLSSVGKGKNA